MKAKKIDFRVQDACDRTLINCQKDSLFHALLGLLENAYEICIAGDKVTLHAYPQDNSICFVIEDTGPGIPESIRQKLCEPFFTTRSQGTGLGLAIAKEVALNHGGDLFIQSKMGQGSKFTFHLPLDNKSR